MFDIDGASYLLFRRLLKVSKDQLSDLADVTLISRVLEIAP